MGLQSNAYTSEFKRWKRDSRLEVAQPRVSCDPVRRLGASGMLCAVSDTKSRKASRRLRSCCSSAEAGQNRNASGVRAGVSAKVAETFKCVQGKAKSSPAYSITFVMCVV